MIGFVSMLAGGVGLFLLGMWLMTDGLKLASGGALRSILDSSTRTSIRGFAAGFFITALVQSSSATTVATVGFVNAGLLTLSQAIWVVIGSNVGTTMTGWIVAMIGIKLQMSALAMPVIGLGMLVRLLGRSGSRIAGLGQAAAGFGVFFLGIDALQGSFSALSPLLTNLDLGSSGWKSIAVFLALGIALTVVTQSSSAALAIILTASATGAVAVELAAAAAIGSNIGTTSTTAFAAISATPSARRVATAHVLFNVFTAIMAVALLYPLLKASTAISGVLAGEADILVILAVFHTLFNIVGAALMWPLVRRMTAYLRTLYVTPAEEIATPRYLDRTLLGIPDLALRALALELMRMTRITFRMARAAVEVEDNLLPPSGSVSEDGGGLNGLGREIRQFADRLAASGPSDSVAQGLQDLIRASQHLGELASATAALTPAELPGAVTSLPDWTTLRDTVRDCLTLRAPDISQLVTPEEAAGLLERIEASYQRLKADLLRQAALGKIPMTVMDNALMHAQAIRRMATIALKAQRRLTPWTPTVETASAADGADGKAGTGLSRSH